MAYKTNPVSLRLGYLQSWSSLWFSEINFSTFLTEDILIQKYLKHVFQDLEILIQEVQINRTVNKLTIKVLICTALISKNDLVLFNEKKLFQRAFLYIYKMLNNRFQKFHFILENDNNIFKTALVLSTYLARQLEVNQHDPFFLTIDDLLRELNSEMSQTQALTQRSKRLLLSKSSVKRIKGLKFKITGCINRVRMASQESILIGSVPLQTCAANIDYSKATAFTKNGTFGVKVWLYFIKS